MKKIAWIALLALASPAFGQSRVDYDVQALLEIQKVLASRPPEVKNITTEVKPPPIQVAPEPEPTQKPPVIYPGWTLLRDQAIKSNSPALLFINCPPRDVDGFKVGHEISFRGNSKPRMMVAVPVRGQNYLNATFFEEDAPDTKIVAALERQVQPSAVPFDNLKPSSAAAQAPADDKRNAAGPWQPLTEEELAVQPPSKDAEPGFKYRWEKNTETGELRHVKLGKSNVTVTFNGKGAKASAPYLPQDQQDYVADLWPEGVPFPPTLKFYKLQTASQRVASFGAPGLWNNRSFQPPQAERENANRDFPWISSGGMDWAKPGTWRNVTGMALPNGKKIGWWLAAMPLKNIFGNIQQEGAMHWEFPTGTQMFDVLIRKNDDGSEHIFTVRRRVKEARGWDDGTSFFPDVAVKEFTSYKTPGNRRTKNVLGVDEVTYRIGLLGRLKPERMKFKESAVQMTDEGHFFPPGFKGTGLTCNKCHNGGAHESKDYGGPLLRGKDTVFSWYPVPENVIGRDYTPTVDNRWPLEQKR